MAQTVDRATLLGYFERRKQPNQAQYADLINSIPLFPADASSAQNALELDQITEKTLGNGVIVSSVTLSAGGINVPNSVTIGDTVTALNGNFTNSTIQTLSASSITGTVSINTPNVVADLVTAGNVTFGNLTQTTEVVGVSTTDVSFLSGELLVSRVDTDGSTYSTKATATDYNIDSFSSATGVTNDINIDGNGFTRTTSQSGVDGYRRTNVVNGVLAQELSTLAANPNYIETSYSPRGVKSEWKDGATSYLNTDLFLSTLRFDVNDFTEVVPGTWQAQQNFPHEVGSENIFFHASSLDNNVWYDVNRPSPTVQFSVLVSEFGNVTITTTTDPAGVSDDLFKVNVMVWHEVAEPTGV
jgi:hypothetical protein